MALHRQPEYPLHSAFGGCAICRVDFVRDGESGVIVTDTVVPSDGPRTDATLVLCESCIRAAAKELGQHTHAERLWKEKAELARAEANLAGDLGELLSDISKAADRLAQLAAARASERKPRTV